MLRLVVILINYLGALLQRTWKITQFEKEIQSVLNCYILGPS